LLYEDERRALKLVDLMVKQTVDEKVDVKVESKVV
jgi:hypothetical protein